MSLMTNAEFLPSFLKKYKSTTHEFTHTSLVGGKWNIPDSELDHFYESYYNACINKQLLYITEKHQLNYSPIVIDFDILYKEGITKRQINESHLDSIVTIFIDYIKLYIKDDYYKCYVMQRPAPYLKKDKTGHESPSTEDARTNNYKDGLHIVFPNIVTEYEFQFIMRKIIINKFQEILDDINNINDIYDVYDRSVIKTNNWCMYLSSKKDIPPYEVTKVYNGNGFTGLELIKELSIRNKPNPSIMINNNEIKNLYDTHEEKKKVKKECIKKVTEEIEEESITKVTGDIENESIKLEIISNNEKILLQIMKLLPNEWLNEFADWIRVTMMLKNNDTDYYNVWTLWCQKSNKYNKTKNDKIWNNLTKRDKGLTINSIYWYAKKNNIEKYIKLMKDSTIIKLIKSIHIFFQKVN